MGGVFKGKEWRCGFGPSLPPGYLSLVAMRARVGSGYPPLPLHGAACWLGVLFMSWMNFAGEFLPATRGNKQYDEKGERAHAYVNERICILMFSLQLPRVDFDFHNTRGVLDPNTQQNGLGYGRGIFLYRDPCVDLDFHNTHESLFPRHTKTGCACGQW